MNAQYNIENERNTIDTFKNPFSDNLKIQNFHVKRKR